MDDRDHARNVPAIYEDLPQWMLIQLAHEQKDRAAAIFATRELQRRLAVGDTRERVISAW